MKRFRLSAEPRSLYLLIGSDPNALNQQFVHLEGIAQTLSSLEVTIENEQFSKVFSKQYEHLSTQSHSLLEYFTYLPSGKYIVSIQANEQVMKMNITF